MEKEKLIIVLAVKFKEVKSNPPDNDFFGTWRIMKFKTTYFLDERILKDRRT